MSVILKPNQMVTQTNSTRMLTATPDFVDDKAQGWIMKLSPVITLIAILIVVAIGIIGVVKSPESQTNSILAFCGTTLAVLFGILKSDFDKAQVVERVTNKVDENTKATTMMAESVKETVLQKGTEVKAALRISDEFRKEANVYRDKKIDKLLDDVSTVRLQTNGLLTGKLEELDSKIEGVKTVIAAAISTPGATGAVGETGSQGRQGEQGNQGRQGEQGNQGRQGEQGEQGEQGNQGRQGESAS